MYFRCNNITSGASILLPVSHFSCLGALFCGFCSTILVVITKRGAKQYQVDKISQHIRNMRHQEEQRRSLERLNLPYTPPKPIQPRAQNIQPSLPFGTQPTSAQHLRMLSINNQNQQNYLALSAQPHFGFSPHVEFDH